MRILAVDDNPIIRMGLRTLLEGAEGVTSVIDTGDPEEAVAHVLAGWVDVVLLDVRMPAVSGLELLPRLAGGATVVMLTHTDDPATVAEAMAAGAAGYLVHGALEPNAMVDAMRLCQGGSRVVSGVTSGLSRLVRDAVETGPDPAVRDLLSPREAEVMDLVAEGLSNREAAERLFVTEKTVRNHITSLFAKLGVTTRSQAIVRWLRPGRVGQWS
ncbi:response regulator transcription factor [Myceligenerans pegani]|uniref:Response regulator transcription factor n=1 Tax=Myceligenerans pegani TaxID=2776917 RepID=A0ABR9N583_9MICO|nr:response regulator transcription factor [Myceligenerans sp. TRM 65318]MBE1878824.1 response regulator transcription factor [Myceligenerans sp. TRM 65318]MBE3021095.1 response regulator transcription factor [Myceligenerans sp. TRM 65318]